MLKRFSLLALLLLASCVAPEHIQRSWPTMGTYAEVELEDSAQADSAAAIVREVFDRVDRTMSIYKRASDISRVNFSAGKEPVAVDPWVIDIIEKSQRAWSATDGAFSINVLAPGIALGIKPAFAMPPPPENVPRWGDDQIKVTASTVFLPHAGMGLDLGGIAKGYALDKAAEALRALGIRRFLISLGRQVMAGDSPRGRRGWAVQLEGDEKIRFIRNESISVSEQGLVSDTGHILDPRSGQPVPGERRVAVSATEGWVADMASTAVFVEPGLRSRLQRDFPSIRWIESRHIASE